MGSSVRSAKRKNRPSPAAAAKAIRIFSRASGRGSHRAPPSVTESDPPVANQSGLVVFYPLLERCHILGHLLACFTADHQGHEDLADAVAGEVDADGQPGTGVGHW